MLKKYLKITLKILLTLLFIPYVIITALLYTITIILPGEIIYKMSVLFAYTGWYLCLLNLRLSGKIEIMSDKLTDSYILISNHIGSLDFILIHELAIRNNMLWFMKYIIKKEALKIPVFGYIMDKIKFVFVSRNFDQDQFILKEHCEEIKKSDRKVWFVVYPEGTRFTQKKKNQSVGYANSINVAPFKNVLFPRGKGLKVIIDNLKESQIKEIIDVTLFYEGDIPSLFYFLFFETNANIKIDVRRVNMKEIDDVNEFLLDSFRRKDCLIDNWNDIYSEKENKKII